MKTTLSSCALFLLLCTASAHAQLYKWVDANGVVTYSDTPPPSVKKTGVKSIAPSPATDAGPSLPYALAEAVKHHPVTLYTLQRCPPCDEGRKLLETRGVPFTEKTIDTHDDQLKLKQISNNGQLPLLTVGRTKQEGFEPDAWNSVLTAAGYPQSSQLPKNYRNPRPAPAAIQDQSMSPTSDQGRNSDILSAPNHDSAAPATSNAPPGFHF